MKHLKQIREWKNSNDYKLDEDNVNDINDIFLPIIDMGCEEFEIIVDKYISQSYNVKWVFPISFSIGGYPDKVTTESIRKHKERLIKFNTLQEETHDILERLLTMGYDIAYYSVEQGSNSRADSIFKFEIRMSRK